MKNTTEIHVHLECISRTTKDTMLLIAPKQFSTKSVTNRVGNQCEWDLTSRLGRGCQMGSQHVHRCEPSCQRSSDPLPCKRQVATQLRAEVGTRLPTSVSPV